MSKTQEKTLFGHPIGLAVLFLTEMWERFSYYGMRALLVLYMSKELIVNARNGSTVYGFDILEGYYPEDLNPIQLASLIYGTYTFLVYCTPILGGLIADRVLGQKKTIIIGGVLMMIGHFLMAFESVFLIALLFIILGNGAFKPNISTQVGDLYPEGDPRRDGAFTIFYMGINLGAIFSGLVCGTLGELYGWHYGFTAAGVGMFIGLVVYLYGQKYLEDSQAKHQKNLTENVQPLTKKEWKAIIGLIVISFSNLVFWGAFEQQGNTMQQLSTNNTDWSVFGLFTMPSTWLQVINPLFIILLATYLMRFWDKLGDKQPSSIRKMAIGSVLLGIGFVFLVIPTIGFTEETQMSFLWFFPMMFFVTLGELMFSPIGLSLVTKVAPARYVGLLMGWWFFSLAGGNLVSGVLGTLYAADGWTKASFFSLMVVLGFALGFAIFLMEKPIKKAVGEGV